LAKDLLQVTGSKFFNLFIFY